MDDSGSTAAVTIHLALGSTYSAADASATALASVVASVSGAVLVRQRIKYRAVNDSPTPAAIGSSITRCGVFILTCQPDTPDAIVTVPAIVDSVILTSGPTAGYGIDTANGDVIAFFDELVAAEATNPFADAITAIDAAYVQSRV